VGRAKQRHRRHAGEVGAHARQDQVDGRGERFGDKGKRVEHLARHTRRSKHLARHVDVWQPLTDDQRCLPRRAQCAVTNSALDSPGDLGDLLFTIARDVDNAPSLRNHEHG
jgi:hypothetical protein